MKPLSERAKHRLRIAAGLLRGSAHRERIRTLSRTDFYTEVAELIRSLNPEDQQMLCDRTDWVEAYDNAGSETGKGVSAHKRAGRATRRSAPSSVDG